MKQLNKWVNELAIMIVLQSLHEMWDEWFIQCQDLGETQAEWGISLIKNEF